ncbi:hypothetical protein [Diplocloster modestus]|uniref:hypothetical protein n=1 Tax=Diplocloster modestus TaxID=2850322 RepID=UPI002ED67865
MSKEENVWLGRLRNDLELKADIEPLAKAYKGMEKNPLYAAAMDLIVRANWKKYQEGRKMCEALRELFADELKERENLGIEQGKADDVLELLGELGQVPEQLRIRVTSQKDVSILSAWLKLAARADSIEEFLERIE